MTAGSHQSGADRNGLGIARPDRYEAEDPRDCLSARAGYHQTWLALSALLLVFCALIRPAEPTGVMRLPLVGSELPTLCMMKRQFGVDCPGCGLTRCFVAMAHGRFVEARAYHPVGVALFLLVAAQVPYRMYQRRRLQRGEAELRHWAVGLLPWLLVAAVFVQWGLRLVVEF